MFLVNNKAFKMTYQELLAYCGGTGYKIAQVCHVSMGTPCHWKKWGFIPIKAQMMIEELTGGKLKADVGHCKSEFDAINK